MKVILRGDPLDEFTYETNLLPPLYSGKSLWIRFACGFNQLTERPMEDCCAYHHKKGEFKTLGLDEIPILDFVC